MQTDRERTCAGCGADNPASAGFCWQCFAPFAPPAPAPRASALPVMPAAPKAATRVGTAPADVSTPSPGRGRTVIGVVVGVVTALVVGALVRNMLAPDYHVPDTRAGQLRIHTQVAQRFEQEMAEQTDRYDVEFQSAVYGTGDAPDVFLVLANGRAEDSADELFDDFLTGAETAGVTVDRAKAVTGQHGDAEYRCVPVSAGIAAVACIWREDRSVGMTLDATPGDDPTATVFAAYDATHA